jgi:hypothetical protein
MIGSDGMSVAPYGVFGKARPHSYTSRSYKENDFDACTKTRVKRSRVNKRKSS